MDYYGAGAPSPLFYNKLFFYISALLKFFFSAKISIILTIIGLMVIGSIGIYKTLSFFKISNLSRVIISISFPFLNYLLMNWLIRGAMTEVAAMCILPWFICWNINFLKNKKFSYWIIPIMFLIYWGHIIMVYYSGFVLMISCFIFYLHNKENKELFCQIIKKSIIAVFTFMILISPYIICAKIFLKKDGYDIGPSLSFIHTEQLSAVENYQKLNEYFLDLEINDIFRRPFHMTFQINLAISILILTLIFLTKKYYDKKWSFENLKLVFKNYQNYDEIATFIITSLIFFLYLMTPIISKWFYMFVPGADFIQFSFRLSVFVSILNLILIGYLFSLIFEKKKNYKLINILSVVYLSFIFINYLGFKRFNYDYKYFTRSEMENNIVIEFPVGCSEYSPSFSEREKLTEIGEGVKYFSTIYRDEVIKLTNQQNPCSFNIRYNDIGKATIKYSVNCLESALIQLPVHYSGYEEINKVENGLYEKFDNYYRTKDSPFIHINLPKGQYELELKMPTMGRVFNKIF